MLTHEFTVRCLEHKISRYERRGLYLKSVVRREYGRQQTLIYQRYLKNSIRDINSKENPAINDGVCPMSQGPINGTSIRLI